MARIDEKNLASVKKTVSTAGPTGGILSAFDIAQSKKLVQNVGGKKAANAQGNALIGINKTAATQGKGKGGTLTKVSTTVKGTPAAKKEELKMSTYQLPDVVNVGGFTYNAEQAFDALKKVENTYGIDSEEYKSLSHSLGAEGGKRKYGMQFKKPDLRKDAGKSYTDTVQNSYQGSNLRNPTTKPYILYEDKKSLELLNKLGVKGERSLSKDSEAVQRTN